MKEYTIGLDLGINNVGWAIVDMESEKIEKCGVRRFNASEGAQDRRIARSTRRRMKRKDTRKHDILNACEKINLPNTNTIDEKLIEKRVKGITEQIEKQDIVNILCYMVTHRGYIPFGDEEVEFINLKGKLPCEYYYELYKNSNNNKYRALRQTVKNSDNIKEIRIVLQNQSNYYKQITPDFIEEIVGIFNRKRKFWEGPGSESSLTPFGRFKTEQDVKIYQDNRKINPNYEKYIFEDLIKTCDIELDEKCASKLNFYAEKYDFLNDFINISFINIEDLINKDCFYANKKGLYKLNRQGLETVFNYIMESKTIITKTLFKNLFNCPLENLSGYRIDEKNKILISTMNYYRTIKASFIKNGGNVDLIEGNIDIYNIITNAMTIAPGNVEVFRMITGNGIELSKNDEEAIKAARKTLKKELKYKSLSEKVLKRAIEDMLKTQMNYMQVSKKFDYEKKARERFINEYRKISKHKGLENITTKFVDNIVSSPQVKKSLRQAIKVINAIINEKGYYPDTIVIESTKETNGKDMQKIIADIQKKKTILRKQAKTFLQGIDENLVTDKNIVKVMLFNEINGQCPYCNKPIKIDQVLNGSIEIEHILPRSKSFDDSFENKTLACAKCNDEKGDKTPLKWLKSTEKEAFQNRIESNNNMSKIKKSNFLYSDEIDKYTTRFFSRNLRDTAYATKELVKQVNLFNQYLKSIEKEQQVKTMSVPGQLTHSIRERYNLEKDRDAGEIPYHHAIDASLIALMPVTELGKQISKFQNNPKFFILEGKDRIMEHINYNMQNYSSDRSSYKNEYDNYIKQINSIDDTSNIFKSSFEIRKDPNGKLSDANIIKLIKNEKEYFKISQIDDIYDPSVNIKLLEKLFDDTKSETLLCHDNNKKLYKLLKEIYEEYKNTKEKISIFELYCREKNGLAKDSKFDYLIDGIKSSENPKSPTIKTLRYYSPINNPFLINKKSINKKDNTYLALDSLSQVCTQVFYNETKNCFAFLPIYSVSVNLKTGKINAENEYYKIMYKKYIENYKVQHIVNLYNGNHIKVDKKDGTSLEGEYQYFDKTNNKICLKNGSYFTKSDKKLTVYDKDVLGNIKERLTYEIK